MLTKSQIKLITGLQQKKNRNQHQLFVVEGKKGVQEFLNSSVPLQHIYTTIDEFEVPTDKKTVIKANELKKISNLKTPNTVVAIFKMTKNESVNNAQLIVALDNVRDPGNLGTIIRLCDWFGIKQLLCSENTVDCYNSKVVQATMGSLTRVSIHYLELESYLEKSTLPKFGAFMDGANIYANILPRQGIIVMGNEANGISSTIEKLIDKKVSIPRFGNLKATESLNVATATAIILSEFCRRTIEM